MAAVDVVLLPRDLEPEHRRDRTVVVFDVLRATTSVAAALAAGVKEIRVFADVAGARAAAGRFGGGTGAALLCGEENCLPPNGFDLGNSPRQFEQVRHGGRVAFLSTTNGTRAILAAGGASVILTGALVNATAVAHVAAAAGRDVTLLCAGTQGRVAMEDVLGAGAVMDGLAKLGPVTPASDVARMARDLFRARRHDLAPALAETRGGQNVLAAGLGPDIEFAAALDTLDVVGVVRGDPPTITAWAEENSVAQPRVC
jgi:2-phosphosulfolactate phosphatase